MAIHGARPYAGIVGSGGLSGPPAHLLSGRERHGLVPLPCTASRGGPPRGYQCDGSATRPLHIAVINAMNLVQTGYVSSPDVLSSQGDADTAGVMLPRPVRGHTDGGARAWRRRSAT